MKPSSMVVDLRTETEVLIRFTPPSDMAVSDLKYRYNGGPWVPQKDPSTGWTLKTKYLAVGDQVVEMDAQVSPGQKHLVGQINLKVMKSEEDGGGVSFGGEPQKDDSTPKARIVIIV